MNSEKPNDLLKPIVITPPKVIEMPNFREVWEARDLLFFLVERDLKTRFQQTFIGVFWIALQPIIQVLIFYLILGILVKVPTGDIPYPLFFLSGFVAWQLFSQIVNSSAFSMTSNIGVITKSYFPRLVLPLSSTISSLIDFVVSFIILIILMRLNNYPITIRFTLIPVLLILTMLFSSGVGLLFGALMVTFRDVKNLLGFILMIWMYMTPIMYPISLVPQEYQIYLSLNPLTSLVESFRWVFLKTGTLPPVSHFLVSFIMMVIIWLLGAIYFRNMENKIADVM
ncbi:MAG: ABC transporter permease [Anaerolineaceae bacterium]